MPDLMNSMVSNTITSVPYRWYAVRCCCAPLKVFGFMKVREDLSPARNGYIVIDNDGHTHTLEFSIVGQCRRGRSDTDGTVVESELAIKSNDRPIEFWRKLPGFVEAV